MQTLDIDEVSALILLLSNKSGKIIMSFAFVRENGHQRAGMISALNFFYKNYPLWIVTTFQVHVCLLPGWQISNPGTSSSFFLLFYKMWSHSRLVGRQLACKARLGSLKRD